MKIVMLGQKGIPAICGGIERHVEELSKKLVDQGHDVLVYARTWHTSKQIKNIGKIKIIHTPSIHTKYLDAVTHTFFSTLHAIAQKPDIYHFHGVGPSLFSWIPRLLAPQAKVITTFHCIDRYHGKWGSVARLVLSWGEYAACRFSHKTISVSATIQSYCLNEYKRNTTKIPNGVSTPPPNLGTATPDRLGLTANKYILMTARLIPHKGAHYLIRAWQIATQNRPDLFTDHKLAIVGEGSFTESYVKKIREAARGDKSIIFCNQQHGLSLQELYRGAKFFVHPSENEGLPLVILEAMSHGRAVLASDIPEHRELVQNEQFRFTNANAMALAEKLILLFENPNSVQENGMKNKEFALQNYNWEKIGKETLEVYRQEKTPKYFMDLAESLKN